MKRGWILLLVCLLLTGCTLMNTKEEKKEESSRPDESSSLSLPDETNSSSEPVEDSKEEVLVIWTTDETPTRIRYDRYWEYGDYVDIEDPETIAAIVQIIQGMKVGEKTNIITDDYTDILTFYFADEGMIRLEFEEQNWVHNGDRYHVDGLGALRSLLTEVMEARWIDEKEDSGEDSPARHQIFVDDGEHLIIFELNDSPAALSLFDQLPIEVEVEDYSDNEKIFYPPEKLDETDAIEGGGEAGTLAYFSPWGDVVMFYGQFDFYPGLYIIGEAIDFAEDIEKLSGTLYIGIIQ